MQLPVPEKLKNLAAVCPFPVYVVGGFVRDSLANLNRASSDIDICAPVTAEIFCAEAEKSGAKINSVYRNTGTVKLSLGNREYEFASFRSDEYVRGVHTPVKTFFTDDIRLDALRRDFKCNAVYYDIREDTFCDPLGGISDVENRRLETVADPDKVFGEDGLRLMRLARQAAQTGFEPTEDCLDGATRNSSLIQDVSKERVWAELNAILHADLRYGIKYAQYRGLKILDRCNVLGEILPELAQGKGMEQNKTFHKYDVLEHSLRTVMYSDGRIRLAALFHDIGKPLCMKSNGNCHEHELIGEELAARVLSRLNAPKKLIGETVKLVGLHMYDFRCDARENKIRKFIVRNGDVIEELLLLKQADYSACRDDLSEAPCVTKWRGIMDKMKAEGAPLTLKQLDVRGDELIAAGIEPERVGEALQALLEDCAIDPKLNKKQALIRRALKYYRDYILRISKLRSKGENYDA